MSRSRIALGVLALVVVQTSALFVAGTSASAVGQDDPTPLASVTVQSLDVVATDFQFEPKIFTMGTGAATFLVRNQGVLDHDFVILDGQRQLLAGSEILAPGRSGTFDATLSAGTYIVVCTIPGHREVGMTAELTVN